jgi:uncharacterized protein (UPF0276 family)
MWRVRLVTGDRFGLGWRPHLAAGILAHLGDIDLLEVLVEAVPSRGALGVQALQFLGRQVPLTLHGTGLGLATLEAVDGRRLEVIARLCEALEPESWSEHLAFVRWGRREIGHLAAPPRAEGILEGLARNVAHAREVVGSTPLLENVASLVEPPLCTFSEPEWLRGVVRVTGAGLLLDLHNLHANAVNGGWDARAALRELPLDRIVQVHLAGGKQVRATTGETRLLDDHLHATPVEVHALLGELGALGAPPLTVILERDGAFPPIEDLLAELAQARATLAEGRRRAA